MHSFSFGSSITPSKRCSGIGKIRGKIRTYRDLRFDFDKFNVICNDIVSIGLAVVKCFNDGLV